MWQTILGGVYAVSLLTLGFTAGWYIRGLSKTDQSSTSVPKMTLKPTVKESLETTSGPLKTMTPLERTQEDNREIKDRINWLIK